MTLTPWLALWLFLLQPAPDEQAAVGPLRAWMARSASGVCQLRLRNVGSAPIEAWTVTVRSADARHTTIVRQDHWRDAYHLPLAASRIEPGDTDAFTIQEDAAVGPLTIRVALVVQSDGIAFGTPDVVPGVGTADDERRSLVARRANEAAEAAQLADAIEGRLATDGLVPMFEARRLSALLEATGELNWWRVRELVLAAEASAPGDASAESRIREAIALLRDAHRRGRAEVTMQRAEPLRPVAVGRCD